jgi:leucyl aminopeptidase
VTIPQCALVSKPSSGSILVIGAVSSQKKISFTGASDLKPLIALSQELGISGEADSFTRVVDPLNPKRVLAIVGLGTAPVRTQALRNAAAVATRKLNDVSSVTFDFGSVTEEDIDAIAEGALLGSYGFQKYKSAPSKSRQLERVEIISSVKNSGALSRSAITAASVALVKDLVNTPANDLYPASFVLQAQHAIKGLAIKATVWDEKALAKDGFGGILGVGQGSSRPPRLMKLEYSPRGARRTIALVGKGITFDTGGLSLKSGAGMIGMKYDMTGAASVLAVIRAAAQLKLKVNITAWLCLAENMPSGTATRPNDVLRIRGGKTVEVLNTDAEGRLVLADGLAAASEEKPDLIVDVATLTGAATTALGTRYTGAMGDAESISHLVELGQSVGETFWHMPLPEEIRAYLNSDIADLANIKQGNTAAGMLVGATFLQQFIGKTSDKEDAPLIPWIHLDVANTANNAGAPFGVVASGPTGVAVRTLIKLSESYATS